MKWISVKERLPKLGETVLALETSKQNDETFKTYYVLINHKNYFTNPGSCSCCDFLNSDEVTHWMPLPEPPHEQI